nr:hypothetical protein [Tanacetum cinerariifolium]
MIVDVRVVDSSFDRVVDVVAKAQKLLELTGSTRITDIKYVLTQKVANPTKVNIKERERAEGEARLLDSTVKRVVPLLPVALARAKSELEASVEILFDEGGSADQGVSLLVVVKKLRLKSPRGLGLLLMRMWLLRGLNVHARKGKLLRMLVVLLILLRNQRDHSASSEAAISGKSSSALRKLLASCMLNVEVGVTTVATLPMVTSLVFVTLEHKSGVPADSITRLNIRTIGASKRFVISLYSSHHSSTNASGAEGDSIIRSDVVPPVMTEVVVTSHVVTVPLVLKTGTKVTSSVHASLF